jgi:tetratricopeptide (TPR) repeat protein
MSQSTTKRRGETSASAHGELFGKRVLNVRLLAATLAVAAVLGGIGYWWYSARLGQVGKTLLQRASDTKEKGEWRESARYLLQYIRLEPKDLDARVLLVEALEKTTVTVPQHRQLISLLYEIVGLMPARNDLRVKLADALLKGGDFAGAETEARKAMSSDREQDQKACRRIIAISLLARAQRGGRISMKQAAAEMARALADNPGDVQVAFLTARLYRLYPQDVEVEQPSAKADAMINQMVALNPRDAQALLTRYQYRRAYGQPDARRDLDTLLEHEPDNVEALLLAAFEDFSTGDGASREAAEKKLVHLVTVAPKDPRGHTALADFYVKSRNQNRAIDVLLSGKKQLATVSVELNRQLAELLIDAGRLDEAERTLAEMEREFRKLIPEMKTAERLSQDNQNRLVTARFHIARDELGQATRELNAVIVASEKVPEAKTAAMPERLQAYSLLATVMVKQQRPDLAAKYFSIVAAEGSGRSDAKWKAGAAYLQLGRPAEAIRQLEEYVAAPNPANEAWLTLVEAHLQQQMRLSAGERDWSVFAARLAEARTRLPDRWELPMMEAQSLMHVGAADSKEKAIELLRDLEQKLSDETEPWRRLVFAYHQLGAEPDSQRALEAYEKREARLSRRLTTRAGLMSLKGQMAEASQLMSEAIDSASPGERLELQLARAQLALASRDLSGAQTMVAGLIEASPKESRLVKLGIEIALEREDYATAAKWEELLKSCPNVDEFDVRYLRSKRLVGQFAELNPSARAELGQTIDSLRTARPSWYPIVSLSAQFAELSEDSKLAIQTYKTAIELGEIRPDVWKRLVMLLFNANLYDEANALMARLNADKLSGASMDSMAIVRAVRENKFKEALALAQDVVSKGSNDPAHHVWLANLLLINEQHDEAEKVLRKAVERFPKDPRAWNGFFNYLVRYKQPEEARRVLQQSISQLELDGPGRHLLSAQGYEMLGDIAEAQREYRQAIELEPKNLNIRLKLAKLLQSSDATAARAQIEEVLRADPKNTDARRMLAAQLATSGESDDWTQAVQLLQSSQGTEDALDDDRLRAVMQSRRGRTREERLQNCAAARQLLLPRLNGKDVNSIDNDRLVLASIYEQEGLLKDDRVPILSARDVLRPLVDRAKPSKDHLIVFIRFLLRYANDLPGDDSDAAGRHLKDSFMDAARLRTGELERVLGQNTRFEDRLLPLLFRVKLLAIEGRHAEAQRGIDEFADRELKLINDEPSRANLYLQIGNIHTEVKNHAGAEVWYRRLMEVAPNGYVLVAKSLQQQEKLNDALELGLRFYEEQPLPDRAALLAQMLTKGSVPAELQGRALGALNAAYKANPRNINLLLSVGVHEITNRRIDKAIEIFKKLLEIDPNNAMALNNLATLLAERPNELGAARKYVQHAIDISGRSPALLDTLGTVLLYSGENGPAIAALEEAIAGAAPDPRYYFHLAVAYKRAGRDDDARGMLNHSRQRGLDQAILTDGDRQLLSAVVHDLSATTSKNQPLP